jgi:hypothetical protein
MAFEGTRELLGDIIKERRFPKTLQGQQMQFNLQSAIQDRARRNAALDAIVNATTSDEMAEALKVLKPELALDYVKEKEAKESALRSLEEGRPDVAALMLGKPIPGAPLPEKTFEQKKRLQRQQQMEPEAFSQEKQLLGIKGAQERELLGIRGEQQRGLTSIKGDIEKELLGIRGEQEKELQASRGKLEKELTELRTEGQKQLEYMRVKGKFFLGEQRFEQEKKLTGINQQQKKELVKLQANIEKDLAKLNIKQQKELISLKGEQEKQLNYMKKKLNYYQGERNFEQEKELRELNFQQQKELQDIRQRHEDELETERQKKMEAALERKIFAKRIESNKDLEQVQTLTKSLIDNFLSLDPGSGFTGKSNDFIKMGLSRLGFNSKIKAYNDSLSNLATFIARKFGERGNIAISERAFTEQMLWKFGRDTKEDAIDKFRLINEITENLKKNNLQQIESTFEQLNIPMKNKITGMVHKPSEEKAKFQSNIQPTLQPGDIPQDELDNFINQNLGGE